MNKLFFTQMSDSKNPVFPEACVVCGHLDTEPLIKVKMSDEIGRLDFYLYNFTSIRPGESFLDIPAHNKCIKDVRNSFFKRFILIIIAAVAIAAAGFMNKLSLFFSIMTFLVIVGIWYALEFRKPVPFEFLHYSQKYVLYFNNRNYAEKFALLNNTTITEGDYSDYVRPM